MLIITYIAILLIFLKFILAIILFLGLFSKLKEINYISIFVLFIEWISIIFSFFTYKLSVLLPFYLTVFERAYYPYVNIGFLVVVSILLILFRGIDDNLIYIHKLLISIYLLFSALPYILLYI
ncbi:hypothetical protein IMK15_00705 [Sneathia sp. DSM 16631]|uniref:hypothetical protein n=1 Tax=Sneathia TaxID=168808 RepID=UPI001866B82F|nr:MULTISPECIES: hypothetical protein [Sneathia]MBE3030504.1 hypothetical protein [Sneathia sp. DSM 16631]MDK9582262.1 hypothetical protein [Sneathia vaginalis]